MTCFHSILKVKKVITIAGNLDHKAWINYHNLPELTGSLNLADYKENFALINQFHYVGKKDKIIPTIITQNFVPADKIVVVDGATHNSDWDKIYPLIYEQE